MSDNTSLQISVVTRRQRVLKQLAGITGMYPWRAFVKASLFMKKEGKRKERV